MREELDNKREAFLKEIESNKKGSVFTNPRSDVKKSKTPNHRGPKSIDLKAFKHQKNPDSEDEDYHLRASKMKDPRHPAKTLYQY